MSDETDDDRYRQTNGFDIGIILFLAIRIDRQMCDTDRYRKIDGLLVS